MRERIWTDEELEAEYHRWWEESPYGKLDIAMKEFHNILLDSFRPILEPILDKLAILCRWIKL